MLIVMHIGAHRSVLPELLAPVCPLPVVHALDNVALEPSTIYVAPPDRHMLVHGGRIRLTAGPKENFTRPAIDPLFRSVAVEYGPRAVAVVLTGDLDDGAAGAAAVRACGGQVIVQAPEDSVARSMPACALGAVPDATVACLDRLAQAIVDAVHQPDREVPMRVDKRTIEIETQIALTGIASPADLDQLGRRSTLTCPDCGGVVWQVGDAAPLRYRCHTGHAFSEASLDAAQMAELEDALWSSVRRAEERAALAASRARAAETLGDVALARSEHLLSEKLHTLERSLREFIMANPSADDNRS
jgi:two-component system chemotaxis response regulator CheB